MVSPFLVFCEMSVVPRAGFYSVHGFMFSFFPSVPGWTSQCYSTELFLKKGFYSGDRRMRSLRPVMAA